MVEEQLHLHQGSDLHKRAGQGFPGQKMLKIGSPQNILVEVLRRTLSFLPKSFEVLFSKFKNKIYPKSRFSGDLKILTDFQRPEKNHMESETKNLIGFNLGSIVFKTCESTISTIPNSFLHSLVFGNIPSEKDENGNFIIHRNPDIFEDILDVYRNNVAILPSEKSRELKFLNELKFYGLEDYAVRTRQNPIRLVQRLFKVVDDLLNISSVYVMGTFVVEIRWKTFDFVRVGKKYDFLPGTNFIRKISLRCDTQFQFEEIEHLATYELKYLIDDFKTFANMEKVTVDKISSLFLEPDQMEEIDSHFGIVDKKRPRLN